MEVKVVDVTKGVFLLLFFYPQILSQLGERCVPMYIEKHYACSRCSNHRRFGEGEHESEHVCVSVCACTRSDSLQRKLDMRLVTWDTVHGWPVNFWRLK